MLVDPVNGSVRVTVTLLRPVVVPARVCTSHWWGHPELGPSGRKRRFSGGRTEGFHDPRPGTDGFQKLTAGTRPTASDRLVADVKSVWVDAIERSRTVRMAGAWTR